MRPSPGKMPGHWPGIVSSDGCAPTRHKRNCPTQRRAARHAIGCYIACGRDRRNFAPARASSGCSVSARHDYVTRYYSYSPPYRARFPTLSGTRTGTAREVETAWPLSFPHPSNAELKRNQREAPPALKRETLTNATLLITSNATPQYFWRDPSSQLWFRFRSGLREYEQVL